MRKKGRYHVALKEKRDMFIEAASQFGVGGLAGTHSRLGGEMSKIGQPLRTSWTKFNCVESAEAFPRLLQWGSSVLPGYTRGRYITSRLQESLRSIPVLNVKC